MIKAELKGGGTELNYIEFIIFKLLVTVVIKNYINITFYVIKILLNSADAILQFNFLNI